MSELEALARRHLGTFNARDMEAWLGLLADDVVIRSESGTVHGRQAASEWVHRQLLRMPGMQAERGRVVVQQGDTIVIEYRLVLPGSEPPAGPWYLQSRICQILRVRDGRIADLHSFYASMHDAGPVPPSRVEGVRIAAEQTALRRVATLVARGISQDDLFAAVNEEIARLVSADLTALLRFEPDEAVTLVAAWANGRGPFPVGSRRAADELLLELARSGRPRRVVPHELHRARTFADVVEKLGIHTAVGVPVMIDGRVWGASFVAAADPDVFPPDTEDRLSGFAELVATSIANAQARSHLRQVAEEQRALRHVATLVAGGASQAELFAAVAEQASRVLGGPPAALVRYEPEGEGVVVAASGGRVPGEGLDAAVGAPIVVAGRPWGAIMTMPEDEPLPPATEDRLAQFAELVATAIGNAESAAEVAASRARIVAAADESRQHIQHDLREGAQRRLEATTRTLRLASGAIGDAGEAVAGLLRESLENAESATAGLRELAQGILPAALDHGGLRAGVESLAGRMDLPVHVDVPPGRLPGPVEKTAYFVVAEALTNAVKHSGAASARVRAVVDDGTLELEIGDDGIGGADPAGGTGLLGLTDRVAAAGGAIAIASPRGGGTTLSVTVPMASHERGACGSDAERLP